MEPARRYAEEAASLDPLSWLTAHAGPHADLYGGNAALAFERMGELANRLAPGEPWPAFEVGYAALQAGLEDEARAWFRQSMGGGSPYYSRFSRLLIHLLDDNKDGAEEILRITAFTEMAGRVGYGSNLVGTCFAIIGRTEEAFEWLERGIDQGFTNHRFMGEYDPLLAPLRGTPRFEELLEKAREKAAAINV